MKRSNLQYIVLIIFSTLASLNMVYGQSRLFQDNIDGCVAERINMQGNYNNPLFSPDNEHILFAGDHKNGVFLFNSQTEESIQISSGISSGYHYYWSPDGKKVGFKQLIKTGERSFMQVPIVYDVATWKATSLCEPVRGCGIPSFSNDGKIVYSVGKEIVVLNSNLQLINKISVPAYSNITPISPDGQKILFNDDDDKIWMVNVDGSNLTQLTTDEESYFSPVWSSDSKKVAVQTITGNIKVVELASKQIYDLGKGQGASWYNDNNYLAYYKVTPKNVLDIEKITMNVSKYDGTEQNELSSISQKFVGDIGVSQDGQKMVYKDYETGKFYSAPFNRTETTTLTGRGSKFALGTTQEVVFASQKSETIDEEISNKYQEAIVKAAPELAMSRAIVNVPGTVPYINQVCDPVDRWWGFWSCGATSAMEIIGYYQILPPWNFTLAVSHDYRCPSVPRTPTSSTPSSPYASYVSEQYSYNGYTYSTTYPACWTTPADAYCSAVNYNLLGYGAYGFIQARTDYMTTFFVRHGLTTSTGDGSPTWAELVTEMNAGQPFVLLGSFYGGGHYVAVVGYDDVHTCNTRDPYYGPNSGYVGYSTALRLYDWPGYNNAHTGLESVGYFNYARGIAYRAQFSNLSAPATMLAGSTVDAWMEYRNYPASVNWSSLTVRLITAPMNRQSQFYTSGDWISASIPTALDSSYVRYNETGRFSFKLKAPDVTRETTYTESFKLLFVPDSRTIEFTNTDTMRSFTIKVIPNATIRGYVYKTDTSLGNVVGNRIANATCVLRSSTGTINTTSTDSAGYYRFFNLTTGTYTVTASYSGYQTGSSLSTTLAVNTSYYAHVGLSYSADTTSPTVPTLSLPVNGYSVIGGTPTFDWSNITDPSTPVTYDLQVDADSNFTNPIINESGLTVSGYVSTTNLADGCTYYWHVRAMDGASNKSNWTSAWQFVIDMGDIVDNVKPSIPTVCNAYTNETKTVSISYGSLQDSSTAYFEWSGASDEGSGVSGYSVYCGTVADADPGTLQTQTTTVYIVATPVSSGTSYYLKVRVKDYKDNWSDPAILFVFRYLNPDDSNKRPDLVIVSSVTSVGTFNNNITIEVNVTEANVSQVNLQYKVTDGTVEGDWVSVPATLTSSNTYVATIPASVVTSEVSQIDYQVIARNNSDQYGVSNIEKVTMASYTESVISATSGGLLKLLDGNLSDGESSIKIESGSIEEGVTLKMAQKNVDDVPLSGVNEYINGDNIKPVAAYEITCNNSGQLFNPAATINLLYFDLDNDGIVDGLTIPSNIQETNLRIFWFDNGSGQWRYLGGDVSKSNEPAKTNIVTAKVNHLTLYALFPIKSTAVNNAKMYAPKEKIITPNSDGSNDYACFNGIHNYWASLSLTGSGGSSDSAQEVKIYDVTNKLVKTLTDGDTWDGKDNNGNSVESGIYIYQYTVDGQIVSGTIMVAK